MPVFVAVACFAFLVHFCFAVVEDEHFDSGLVACLAAAAVGVALPDFELVLDSEELLVSMADSYCLGSEVEGSP